MKDKIYITGHSNRIFEYNFSTEDIRILASVSDSSKRTMGISILDNFLFVGSNRGIFKYKLDDDLSLIKEYDSGLDSQYHHLKIYDDRLYITNTKKNSIDILDLDLKFIRSHKLDGKNHINSLCFTDRGIFVCLNQMNGKFGMSGIAYLDFDLVEKYRYEYGWQSHGFTIVDDMPYTLCNCGANQIGKFNIRHPKFGGLLVGDTVVYQWGTKWFCYDISMNDDFIYIIGGSSSDRKDRSKSNSLIIILDRNTFMEKAVVRVSNAGGFLGCTLGYGDKT